jgi:hypothetical protein
VVIREVGPSAGKAGAKIKAMGIAAVARRHMTSSFYDFAFTISPLVTKTPPERW